LFWRVKEESEFIICPPLLAVQIYRCRKGYGRKLVLYGKGGTESWFYEGKNLQKINDR